MSNLYTQEEIEFLKKNYPVYGSKYCIERLKNHTAGSIKVKIVYMGLKINKEKLYEKNDFYNISSPEMAYFLGYFWADGHIGVSSVGLEINSKDGNAIKETLNKIAKWKTYSRQRKNWKPITAFSINRVELINVFRELKFKDDANFVLNRIPEHLKHYWFRGLMDGDGNIFHGEKHGIYNCSVSSVFNEDWSYFTTILDKMKIPYNLIRTSRLNKRSGKVNSCSQIMIRGQFNCTRWCDYIYQNWENDKIGLSRKYDSYIKIKEKRDNRKKTKTGYLGVKKTHYSFYTKVKHKNKEIYVGSFPNEIEAAIAYDKKLVELKGIKARTNFPIENYLKDINLLSPT